MSLVQFDFKSKIWLYQFEGATTWHFVTMAKKESLVIKDLFSEKRKGWGSIKVTATIGNTTWNTAIFPGDDSCYALPIKAAVRKAEKIQVGDLIKYTIEIDPD